MSVDDELARIMSVDADIVRALAHDLLNRTPALAAVGVPAKVDLQSLVA
jgi:hypothetical protein